MFRKLPAAITAAIITAHANLAIAQQQPSGQQAGGLQPVVDTGNNVIATLDAVAPLIMLASILIAGTLVLFRAASMGIVASVLAGGVLLAGAPEIVDWFGL